MATDTITQLADDPWSVAFADALALRLDLRRDPLGHAGSPDALLAVAPASQRRPRELRLPVLTFTRSAAARPPVQGRVVMCGARDEGDAPAFAIADAIAQRLDLRLLLVHVLPAIRAHAYASVGVLPPCGPTPEDRAWASAMLDRLAEAAGLEAPGEERCRLRCGGAATDLAALARAEDAALVVVSATGRSRLARMLSPSVANQLPRRCERPVLVCPRDPAAAMRIREALGWSAACSRG